MSYRAWIASGGNEADAFAEDDRERESAKRAEMSAKQRPAVHPKVYELASYFLLARPTTAAIDDEIWQLAGVIQTACEDAVREQEARQLKRKGE